MRRLVSWQLESRWRGRSGGCRGHFGENGRFLTRKSSSSQKQAQHKLMIRHIDPCTYSCKHLIAYFFPPWFLHLQPGVTSACTSSIKSPWDLWRAVLPVGWCWMVLDIGWVGTFRFPSNCKSNALLPFFSSLSPRSLYSLRVFHNSIVGYLAVQMFPTLPYYELRTFPT